MFVKKIIFYFAILFCLFGCESNEQNENLENILNANSHIIDTIAIKNSSTNLLSIFKDKVNFKPAIGDILLASPSQRDSLGVLVKVTSVSITGDSYDCTTEASNLNSAFKQLFIDGQFSPSYNNSVSNRSSDAGSSLGIHFNHNQTISAGLDIDGDLNLNFPATRIRYIKKEGSILPEEVLVAQDFNTEGSFLKLTGDILQSNEFSLHRFDLPIIYVPVAIGPTVVLIPFTQKVDLKVLPASISGTMTYKVFPVISATVGISYKDGAWQNLSTYSINAYSDPLNESDFSNEMTASITAFNPTYEISPMGLERFKLSASLPNSFDLTIKQTTPNYSLKYKLGIDVGLNVEFWTGIDVEYGLNLPLFTQTITEGNFSCYEVGDQVFGGIVFYVDPNDCSHGLVASPTNQSNGILLWDNAVAMLDGSSWRLPTISELEKIYDNRNIIPGLGTLIYWSGTEYAPTGGGDVYCLEFSNGQIGIAGKIQISNTFAVRGVKSF